MRLYLTSLYTQQINDKLICWYRELAALHNIKMFQCVRVYFPFLTLIMRFTELTIRDNDGDGGSGDDNGTEAFLCALSFRDSFFFILSYAHFQQQQQQSRRTQFHAKVNVSLCFFSSKMCLCIYLL